MAPILAQAARNLEPRARFAKINVDENPDAARQYGVQGIPALFAFRGGKVAARQAGVTDPNTLRGWVERLTT
jgi:thioredoxin 2